MFFRLVKQLAEKEGVNEQLKADNQMLWVQSCKYRVGLYLISTAVKWDDILLDGFIL